MMEWVGALAGALNGGWALRLESKVAEMQADRAGDVKLNDERHEETTRRLERIESKQDEILERLPRR